MSILNDHKKPRRDRIAREAEEAEARSKRFAERAAIKRAYDAEAIKMIVEGTRWYFTNMPDHWNYPNIAALQDVLDHVRLEFYRYQKEIGIGGHK